MPTEPFLKWPGGKRWLVGRHQGFFPPEIDRYVEPFLGSGAVFFRLAPTNAILADTNSELVNAYRCVQRCAHTIDRELRELHKSHNAEVYYRMREMRPRDAVGRAVRFIYLNRTCFNGIYRVNKQGAFNVPMGSKTMVEYPLGFLAEVASRLREATIEVADFEMTIGRATRGDFLYVDPPYTVKHNTNNFVKYNAHLFSWADQVRLAEAVRGAAKRGARVMVSNADHASIRDLYRGFGEQRRVGRTSVLAAGPENRGKSTELVITNYEVPG
jgi:DNA adenine methylase